MSDQLELDLDGYCPPAPTPTTSGAPLSGNSAGSINYNGGVSPLWYPVYGRSSGNYSIVTGGNTNNITGTAPATCSKPATPKEKNKDGCTCKKCQEFFPYAESNQDDGSLICYGCKLWM
jgi:hypothetical protein